MPNWFTFLTASISPVASAKLGQAKPPTSTPESALEDLQRFATNIDEYQRHGGMPANRVIGLGLPILDLYDAQLWSKACPKGKID